MKFTIRLSLPSIPIYKLYLCWSDPADRIPEGQIVAKAVKQSALVVSQVIKSSNCPMNIDTQDRKKHVYDFGLNRNMRPLHISTQILNFTVCIVDVL